MKYTTRWRTSSFESWTEAHGCWRSWRFLFSYLIGSESFRKLVVCHELLALSISQIRLVPIFPRGTNLTRKYYTRKYYRLPKVLHFENTSCNIPRNGIHGETSWENPRFYLIWSNGRAFYSLSLCLHANAADTKTLEF